MSSLRDRIVRNVVKAVKNNVAPPYRIKYTKKETPVVEKKNYIKSSKPNPVKEDKPYSWGAYYKNGYRLKK